ncbi:glycosyl transferase group 1 [Parafrankia sp. EAN1pec]|uniref:glycosyltransferase family 4 protein n=1 Tax=Parafrankia sp. (strain EAN1pec) TaxID=298653 RepID=UPI0000540990|nr:glycosyl transferase group 1 [Frankia sp. EAN1pec]
MRLGDGNAEGGRAGSLRVLYSISHPLGRPGIATTALYQVRGLIAAGFQVTVYCTSLAIPVPATHRVVQTMVARGVRIPNRAVGVRRAYAYHDWCLARELARRPHTYDVVHAWPRGCVRTLRTARRIGLPAFREVCSPHSRAAFDLAGREAAATGVRLPRRHAQRGRSWRLRLEEAEYAAASWLLCPSDHVVRTFIEHGVDAGRLVRHQYGFDPDRFRPALGPRPADRPFTVAFAGRGEPNKGLHYALRAWRDAGSPGTFLICGVIMPDYRARLGELLGLPGVRELGFVSDLDRVLRESDALVLPSVSEGSALVTLEAAGSGCIPVVSDACGSPTRHLIDGLVHRATDTAELTRHLRLLAEEPTTRARLRAACIAGRDAHTWARAGERLAEIYQAAVRARPGGAPG